MTFARNALTIKHSDGFGLEFKTLDALRGVSKEPLDLEVGVAKLWQGARTECEFAKRSVVKPFDWTYSSDYQGSLIAADSIKKLVVCPTDERIDIEKLRPPADVNEARFAILYSDNVDLFEDELADHGIAQTSVKIVSVTLIVVPNQHVNRTFRFSAS